MCKFSVIDNNYLPVAISQDGLVQWFPTWGKFPPGGKFEAIRGEIITLATSNKKISD